MRFGRRRLGTFQLRRRRFGKLLLLAMLLAAAVWVFRSVVLSVSPADAKAARQAVHQFYALEQASDFGSAWEMFHPYMQQKFNKSRYIQTRNHIIMEHFGVDTYEFTVGEAEHVGAWSMSFETPALSNVYRIPVTQRFRGQTFGVFDLHQEVYAVKSEEEWQLLWAYP